MPDEPVKNAPDRVVPPALQDTKAPFRRATRRCSFVAAVEVTELQTDTRISARTSEISLGGCYVDMLGPFPVGSLVQLRIVRDDGVFEAKARVAYSQQGFGMGLQFIDMTPESRTVLQGWLAEMLSRLTPTP
jgi:hypothetical protein